MIHGEIEPEGEWSEAQLEAFEAMGIEVEREDDEAELAIPLNLTFANPDLLVSVGVGPDPARRSATSPSTATTS